MTRWPSYRLDELGFVGRGRSTHRPRNDPALYGGDIPFFQTGDVKAAGFWLRDATQTYGAIGLAQSKLWPPGTVCITIAANIAETAMLAVPAAFPDSVVGFVADPGKADARFVKYSLDTLRSRMQSISRGTTQDNLSLDKLFTFPLRVPPLPEQRRIAGILSAYDELIENCERRIRLLDEMARVLYREWFVKFRYPGHEKVPLLESAIGRIPKGWRAERSEVLATETRRGVPKGILESSTRYVGLEHIPRRSLALDAWEETVDLGSNKLAFKRGEVLFGKIRPYFHKVSVAPFDGICSADTFVASARTPLARSFVTCLLSSDAFVAHASATANGAKMPRANWNVMMDLPIAIPPDQLIGAFAAHVEPLIDDQQSLVFRIANLRKTRDLLLPRLLSGRLSVDPSP